MGVTLYGYDLSEIFLFGIICYIGAIFLVLIIRYCVINKLFCANSPFPLHCEVTSCCCHQCQNCYMLRAPGSIFCCRRQHSVKEDCCESWPSVHIKCFRPSCKLVRCFCCEFIIEEEVKSNKIFVTSLEHTKNRTNMLQKI